MLILDPGHGGRGDPRRGLRDDPGLVAPGGACEADIVLAYAQAVAGVMPARLTRTAALQPRYRERTAHAAPGDTFLSLHLGLPRRPRLILARPDSPSVALAERLAAALGGEVRLTDALPGGHYLDDVSPGARSVLLELGALTLLPTHREARLSFAYQLRDVLAAG